MIHEMWHIGNICQIFGGIEHFLVQLFICIVTNWILVSY